MKILKAGLDRNESPRNQWITRNSTFNTKRKRINKIINDFARIHNKDTVNIIEKLNYKTQYTNWK